MDDQVKAFIDAVPNVTRREDALALIEIMREETGQEPYLWGASIIGFGIYHYKYDSGREGDTVTVGFSPRKQALAIYGIIFYEEGTEKLDKLGKHEAGKGCLYINRLADVDEAVLREMIREAYASKAN